MSRETKLVNMHHASEWAFRIDRKSPFGNPFKLKKDGGEYTRKESIEKYREWFYEKIENDPEFKEKVHHLKGNTLACWCKPKDCHGDVIVDYLENEVKE